MPILSLNRRQDKRDPDRGPYENPWKEIEGTVRKVDEEKVKDCTEDIDTLLVFAGLYSAVLTAFLIESYKNLFADESESLLRQMVLQSANFKFNNGYLNSTFDPSQLPTFKAAVSDIRVNVCWFASLILSLSSASFGIAVKQWLREFLAMDYISPQERLRIRDARIHGLQDWKLFQIAAFLPILLQVSLLLFFVGLCFFTASVHPSIGVTSLFLVSCWAFLFFMSVIAPLFSPRCPYKTTILKVPFRYARPRVRAFFRLVYQRLTVLPSNLRRTLRSLRSRLSASPATLLRGAWLWLRAVSANIIQWLRSTRATFATGEQDGAPNRDSDRPGDPLGSIHLQTPTSPAAVSITSGRAPLGSVQRNLNGSAWARLASLPARLLRCLRADPETQTRIGTGNDESRNARGRSRWQYYDDYMDLGILGTLSQYVIHEDTTPEEEDTMRNANTNDLIIFRNIDSAFFDDSLLACMPQALSQRLPLSAVLQFVMTIIQNRSESSLSSTAVRNSRKRGWPWTMSLRVRLALVDMIVESMEYELPRKSHFDWWRCSTSGSEWRASFVVLTSLVSTHDRAPSSVTRLFEGLNGSQLRQKDGLKYTPFDVFSNQIRRLARSDPDWPARLLLFLAKALSTLNPKDAERCLRYIVHRSFLHRHQPPREDTYRRLLERDPNDVNILPLTPHVLVALLEVTRVILDKYTIEQAQSLDKKFPAWINLLLEFVFNAVPRVSVGLYNFCLPLTGASDGPGLGRIVADLFISPHTTRALLNFFAAHLHVLPSPSRSDWSLVLDWYGLLHHTTRDVATTALDAWSAFFDSHPILDSPVVLLRFCLLMYCHNSREDKDVDTSWHKLFTVIHARYERILHDLNTNSNFDISQLTCHYSVPDDEHTDLCNTTWDFLHYCAFTRTSNMMVAFLRKFLCASHTLNQCGDEFRLIVRLEQEQPRTAALARLSYSSSSQRRESVSVEDHNGHSAVVDSTPMKPTAVDSLDGQLDDGLHTSAREDSGPGGLVAAEPSQRADLAYIVDTEPQDRPDVDASDLCARGSHSATLQGLAEPNPSGGAAIFSVAVSLADARNASQAGGSLANSLDHPTAIRSTEPLVIRDQPIHSAYDPRPPTFDPLPDHESDALEVDLRGGNKASNATAQPLSCAAIHAGCDNSAALLHAFDSGDSGGNAAGPSREGSGLGMFESSGIPAVHGFSGDASGIDIGTEGARPAMEASQETMEDV